MESQGVDILPALLSWLKCWNRTLKSLGDTPFTRLLVTDRALFEPPNPIDRGVITVVLPSTRVAAVPVGNDGIGCGRGTVLVSVEQR